MSEYVTICYGGAVRLYDSGVVKHYDANVGLWRNGWGPYATVSILGEDERIWENWRERVRACRAEDKR